MANRDYFREQITWDGSMEYPATFASMPTAQGFEAAAGVVLRPFFGQRLMASYVTFAPGADAPIHQHSQEQFTIVISGRLLFTVGETTRWMESGDIVSIPSNVPHKATAGDQGCVAIDMFSPIRDGFRELMAAQSQDPLNKQS